MGIVKRGAMALAAVVLLLAAAVAINTLRQGSRQLDVPALPVLPLTGVMPPAVVTPLTVPPGWLGWQTE